jgi:hypothetical protein
MIEKKIDFDGYNIAEIISINKADEPLCNLKQVDENGNIIRHDSNISFPVDNMPFELTEEDIDEINNPKTEVEDEEIQ